ncbi:MAG TPA: glycosyltransferase family 2 protein [Pyrinomonadaceae bacterium]|nr:glycosyltransferase family 2 protein [Pyrinomonadaceae bacterium]
MSFELSIVVVNWNGGPLLGRCVESVAARPPSVDFEVIVVDNASADDSVARMREGEGARALAAAGRLRVVENEDNRGFGRANNQAFGLTRAPLLFLLNPDTEVTPGAVDRLIATVRSGPRVGAAGPKLLNADGSLQVSVWRNPPAAWEMLLTGLRLHRLLPRRVRGELLLADHWDYSRRRAVEMLSGAAVLVRREVVDEVGGFDERFHMYGEDNEWCLRMVRAGWELVFEPEAVVMHHGAASSLKRWDELEKRRVQAVAFLDFQRHCLPRRRRITNLLTSCFLLSVQRTARRLRGLESREVEMTLRLHAADLKRALRDG